MADTLERLEAIRDKSRRAIAKLDESSDASLVATELEAAGLQARFWRAVSMISEQTGNMSEARNAAVLAEKFSAQQTRAAKATIADRLSELERRRDDRVKAAVKLRAL
jgi:hypothetical protein